MVMWEYQPPLLHQVLQLHLCDIPYLSIFNSLQEEDNYYITTIVVLLFTLEALPSIDRGTFLLVLRMDFQWKRFPL